jgi:hypothetical protein
MRIRASVLVPAALCFALVSPIGCGARDDEVVQYDIDIDLTVDHARFVFHYPTWGWPIRWPTVSSLAIASDEDGLLWRLEATDPEGVPARELTIVYGETPDGFSQVDPSGNVRPRPLTRGRVYFVGATGRGSVFRAVFALPVGRYGAPPRHDWVPDSQPADGTPDVAREQAEPAD